MSEHVDKVYRLTTLINLPKAMTANYYDKINNDKIN